MILCQRYAAKKVDIVQSFRNTTLEPPYLPSLRHPTLGSIHECRHACDFHGTLLKLSKTYSHRNG